MAESEAKIEATTEATPKSEHGGGFPPFQKDTFASQLIWLAIFFVALYLIAAKLALPRVGSILADRRGRIAGDLAEASRMKDAAAAAETAYQKSLAEARTKAQALAAATRDKLQAEAETNRKTLETSLHARLAQADTAIAATKAAAMTNVRGIAQEAAAAIVARLTGATPPPEAVAAAVDTAIKR